MGDASYMLSGFREMVKSDLQGGTVTFLNQDFDATVGTFEQRDVFSGAGVVPMLLGDVQLATADLPPDITFNVGMKLTVTPATGNPRDCRLHAVAYSGPVVSLTLHDENERV